MKSIWWLYYGDKVLTGVFAETPEEAKAKAIEQHERIPLSNYPDYTPAEWAQMLRHSDVKTGEHECHECNPYRCSKPGDAECGRRIEQARCLLRVGHVGRCSPTRHAT